MLNKILMASAATMILAGATIAAPVTADAAMTCKEAAKMQYPDDRKMRHDWKKACKENWKMHAGKDGGLLGKFKLRDRS